MDTINNTPMDQAMPVEAEQIETPTPAPEAVDPIVLDAEIADALQSELDDIIVEAVSEDAPTEGADPDAAEAESADQAADPVIDPAKHAPAVGKVVAGAAIAAAGVPMLILPGPGVAAIAAGGLIAAKGVSELTGKEHPVISQIEQHPEYQAAAKTAKDATDAVGTALTDAAKQIPGVIAGAGKAAIDATATNLPDNVKQAAEKAAPAVKSAAQAAEGAAKAATPVVEAAGKGISAGLNAGFKALGDLAGNLTRK